MLLFAKWFQQWKEAPLDAFVLSMYQIQTYYGNEVQRGLAGMGTYHLLDSYKSEALDAEDIQVDNTVCSVV